MFGFEYYSPTKVIFGKGTENQAGELVKAYGAKKVLIHYGGKSAVKSGLIDRVKASLDAAGVAHVELGGVVPNPHLSKVREGIALGKKEGIDFILAVGGGSTIDSSKAISYGLAEPEKDVWELFEKKRTAQKFLPIASVLTIAAAGSETSNSCVITNEETKEKRSYNDDIARPKFAIMNPELTMTLPDYQTESGCTDIMMHTMERYFVEEDSINFTDEIAFGLLKAVIKAGKKVMENPNDFEARASLMLASSFSHNGLTGMGTKMYFTVHRLEHVLSGTYDNVSHGAGLAVLFPAWAKWVYPKLETKFLRFALEVMKVEKQDTNDKTIMAAINKLESFYKELGMPTRFKDLKIDEKAVDELIKKSTNIPSFIKLDSRDIEMIYKNAL